ncbi:MAG: tyrosine-type recombinase/integrase [Candidatus Dormibacter sp.]
MDVCGRRRTSVRRAEKPGVDSSILSLGTPVSYSKSAFRGALGGLPHIRFHDLRHSAATLMLSRGVHPKLASEMLGHSTIAITLDLYSHVSANMQREAADAIDAALADPMP